MLSRTPLCIIIDLESHRTLFQEDLDKIRRAANKYHPEDLNYESIASSLSQDLLPPMSIEERLHVLKRLQAQGLITEEEYRAKKQQLLDRF